MLANKLELCNFPKLSCTSGNSKYTTSANFSFLSFRDFLKVWQILCILSFICLSSQNDPPMFHLLCSSLFLATLWSEKLQSWTSKYLFKRKIGYKSEVKLISLLCTYIYFFYLYVYCLKVHRRLTYLNIYHFIPV